MDRVDKRRSRQSAAALGLILLASAVVSAISTARAIDHRQLAEAAMTLQMATTEVAHADELLFLGVEPDPATLVRPMQILNQDSGAILALLSPSEAERAGGLLDEIRGCGVMLLETGEHTADHTEPHDHTELEQLLTSASQSAARDASTAEQTALAAITGALGVSLMAGWLAIRSRYRNVQVQSLIDTERQERRRLQSLLEDSPDSRFVISHEGRVTYRSRSAEDTFEPIADLDELLALCRPEQRAALRAHLRQVDADQVAATFELGRVNGQDGWFEIRVSDLRDDEIVSGHLVAIRDITAETKMRRELERRATTDALTGLLNRRMLEPRLDAAKAQIADGRCVALLTFDIDGFKTINDTLGHPIGDQLLVLVAARLQHAVEETATLIRIGGDEFAVIVPGVADSAEALQAGQRLIESLAEPFTIGARREFVRTSVGVAVASQPDDVARLMTWSDLALYEAKRKGGETVELYDPALEKTVARQHQVTRALRDADLDAEFAVAFQPIVDAQTKRISSLEALARWSSPDLGSVSPGEFIPIAEVSGQVCSIGRWVFDRVCCQMAAWIEAGIGPDVTVSFNVSAYQLAEPTFVPGVLETARRWGVPPERLVIEVTESAALDRSGIARRRIHELRDAGFRISIDDFGAGYSNLGQLLTIPFDIIKIDRSLLITLSEMRMQAGGDATDACSIMQAIVSIASILDAPVVSEGVETEQQRQSLVASGITHIQGYLTGRPGPAGDYTAQLLEHHVVRA